MVMTQPTVEDFSDTTVMRVIRKIVNYICSDSGLVAQINDNDITGFTSSYTNNLLKIDATKGDGTKIPVCSLTIEGGSSTGNPYPTGISGTVGVDGNITFTVTMSSGSPLTTTINMNYFASAKDLSDLQKQVKGLKLTSSGNNMSINGTNASIVNSISGQVTNGNLKITINGVESGDIPLPEGELEVMVKQIATYVTLSVESSTGYNRNFIRTYDVDNVNLSNEFPVFDENNHIIGKGQQKYGITNILHYEGNLTKYLPNSEIIKGIKSMFSFNIADGTYLTYIIFAQTNPGQSGYTQASITVENNEITSINTQNVYLPDSFSTGNVPVVINFCGLKKSS